MTHNGKPPIFKGRRALEKNNSGDKTQSRQSGRQPSAEKSHTSSKQLQRHNCPIVGIGASAGGLSAMVQLFESMPEATGLAFVVIQHLDANNESALSNILSKATAMPVSEVKDDVSVQPNHVYAIAPGTELTFSQ